MGKPKHDAPYLPEAQFTVQKKQKHFAPAKSDRVQLLRQMYFKMYRHLLGRLIELAIATPLQPVATP
jgi:hypothetical protein